MYPEDIALGIGRFFREDGREALRHMVRAEADAREAYSRQYDQSALAMRDLWARGTPHICFGQAIDSRCRSYPVILPYADAIGGGHMLFTGATGSGKTALGIILLAQILACNPRRSPQIIVEPKRDLAPFVRDVLVPSLVATLPGGAAVALANRFVTLNVFDPASVVPFQVLTRDPTLSVEEQSIEVTTSFTRTVGLRDIGPLQESSFRLAVMAGIDVGLNMEQVVRLLRNEAYRREIVPRITHPDAKDYFTSPNRFARERPAGLAALLNRLDALLAVPGLRRLLAGPGMVRFPDLLDGYLTVIDLSGAPAGMREAQRFIGELMVARLVRSVFARNVTRDSETVGLWMDEFQELLTPELAADAERVFAMARTKRCFLRIFHQSGAQFADGNFLRIVRSMSNYHAMFRSDEQDARYLEAFLPVVREPPTAGEDAEASEAVERASRRKLLEAIPRLPDRTFIWWDKRQAHPAIVARTPTYDFASAKVSAAALPAGVISRLRAGVVERVAGRSEQAPPLPETEAHHVGPDHQWEAPPDEPAARVAEVLAPVPHAHRTGRRARRVQLG